MELGSQFLNCSGLPSVPQLKAVNLSNIIFAIVCLIVLLLLLAFLMLYRAYRTTLQRLLLCVYFSVVLSESSTISSVEVQFDITEKVCMWIGLWDAWSSNLIEFFSFGFTVCLIAITYQQLKGKKLKFWKGCMKYKVHIEVVYICATFIFPFCYLWVPLYDQTYGLGQTLCVSRTYDDDCQPLNHSGIDSLSLQLVWLTLDIMVIISFLVLIVVLALLIIKLKRSSNTFSYSTIKRTIILLIMLSISLAVRIGEFSVNLGIRVFNVTIDNIAYDAIDNPAYTLSNLIIPIGFTVYLYSSSKLRLKSLKKAVRDWMCCGKRHVQQKMQKHDHSIIEDELASVESSIEVDAPSHTTFNQSLYTNEFTDATTPLISQEDNMTTYITIQ